MPPQKRQQQQNSFINWDSQSTTATVEGTAQKELKSVDQSSSERRINEQTETSEAKQQQLPPQQHVNPQHRRHKKHPLTSINIDGQEKEKVDGTADRQEGSQTPTRPKKKPRRRKTRKVVSNEERDTKVVAQKDSAEKKTVTAKDDNISDERAPAQLLDALAKSHGDVKAENMEKSTSQVHVVDVQGVDQEQLDEPSHQTSVSKKDGNVAEEEIRLGVSAQKVIYIVEEGDNITSEEKQAKSEILTEVIVKDVKASDESAAAPPVDAPATSNIDPGVEDIEKTLRRIHVVDFEESEQGQLDEHLLAVSKMDEVKVVEEEILPRATAQHPSDTPTCQEVINTDGGDNTTAEESQAETKIRTEVVVVDSADWVLVEKKDAPMEAARDTESDVQSHDTAVLDQSGADTTFSIMRDLVAMDRLADKKGIMPLPPETDLFCDSLVTNPDTDVLHAIIFRSDSSFLTDTEDKVTSSMKAMREVDVMVATRAHSRFSAEGGPAKEKAAQDDTAELISILQEESVEEIHGGTYAALRLGEESPRTTPSSDASTNFISEASTVLVSNIDHKFPESPSLSNFDGTRRIIPGHKTHSIRSGNAFVPMDEEGQIIPERRKSKMSQCNECVGCIFL